jgi:HAMP domain-containing protein
MFGMVLGSFLTPKIRLYGAIGAIIVLALLSARFAVVRAALARAEAARDRARLDAIIEQKGMRDEISESDDRDLVDGLLGRR